MGSVHGRAGGGFGRAGRARGRVGGCALFLLAASLPAGAATPLRSIAVSPDVALALAGATLDDEEIAEDDLAGGAIVSLPAPVPAGADLTGYHRLSSGDELLSFDVSVALPGFTAWPGDVVRRSGSAYTLAFSATFHGAPFAAAVDAIGAVGEGDLLLSFDTTLAIGGILVQDEDLVRFDGASFALFFDGSARGVAAGLDLDAVHHLDRNGHLLLSFDGGGSLGGLVFDDDDVLEFSPGSGTWELAYDGAAFHPGWEAADLDALYAVDGGCLSDPECADGRVCNGAERCDFPTGRCLAGTPPICDDGSACTKDSCSEEAGGCRYEVIVPPPGPVGDTLVAKEDSPGGTLLAWTAIPDATHYNTYRGSIPRSGMAGRASGPYDHACHESDDDRLDGATASADGTLPPPGAASYYLVSGEHECGEGSLGQASGGSTRPNDSPCPTPP